MSDDAGGELPADPWVGGPFSAMLDDARLLRHALLDARNLDELFAAIGALSDEELRLVVVEFALDALWSRRSPRG